MILLFFRFSSFLRQVDQRRSTENAGRSDLLRKYGGCAKQTGEKDTLHYIHATRKQYFGLLFLFFKLERTQGSRKKRTQGGRSDEGEDRDKNDTYEQCESSASLITRGRECPRASYFPSAYLYCSGSPNRLYSWSEMTRVRVAGNISGTIACRYETGAVRHTRTHIHTHTGREDSKTGTRIWTFTHVRVRRDLFSGVGTVRTLSYLAGNFSAGPLLYKSRR